MFFVILLWYFWYLFYPAAHVSPYFIDSPPLFWCWFKMLQRITKKLHVNVTSYALCFLIGEFGILLKPSCKCLIMNHIVIFSVDVNHIYFLRDMFDFSVVLVWTHFHSVDHIFCMIHENHANNVKRFVSSKSTL